jgi:predicted dehydrogenase
MKSGRYGRVLAATMRRYSGRPTGWFGEQARSGGVKLDLHIHDVDAALWWWGKPDSMVSHTSGLTGGVTAVLSHWHYKDGLAVHMEALWDIGTPFASDFRIVMEEATLDYSMCNDKGLLITTREGTRPVEMRNPEASPYRDEVAYFIRCVTDRTDVSRCPPEESALAVECATL